MKTRVRRKRPVPIPRKKRIRVRRGFINTNAVSIRLAGGGGVGGGGGGGTVMVLPPPAPPLAGIRDDDSVDRILHAITRIETSRPASMTTSATSRVPIRVPVRRQAAVGRAAAAAEAEETRFAPIIPQADAAAGPMEVDPPVPDLPVIIPPPVVPIVIPPPIIPVAPMQTDLQMVRIEPPLPPPLPDIREVLRVPRPVIPRQDHGGLVIREPVTQRAEPFFNPLTAIGDENQPVRRRRLDDGGGYSVEEPDAIEARQRLLAIEAANSQSEFINPRSGFAPYPPDWPRLANA